MRKKGPGSPGGPRTAGPQLRAAREQAAAPWVQVTPHRGEKGEAAGDPRPAVTRGHVWPPLRKAEQRSPPGPARGGAAPRAPRQAQASTRSPGLVRTQPGGPRGRQVSAAAARGRGRAAAPRASRAPFPRAGGRRAARSPAGLRDALGGSAPSRSSRPVKTRRCRRRPPPLTCPQRLTRPPPASRPARSAQQRAPSARQPAARREAPAPTGASRLRPRPAVTLPLAPANGARAAEPLTGPRAGRRLRRTKAPPRPARPSPRTCGPPSRAVPAQVPFAPHRAARPGRVGRTGRKQPGSDERPVPRPGRSRGSGAEDAAPPLPSRVQTNGQGKVGGKRGEKTTVAGRDH